MSVDATHTVLDQVHAERNRQLDYLGYTREHDDLQPVSAIVAVAEEQIAEFKFGLGHLDQVPDRGALVKAAAALVAAIERFDRVTAASA